MKIPKPQQLPSGSWRVQCMVDGKRYSQVFPTEDEAMLWSVQIKTGAAESVEDMTVGRAIDRYIAMKDSVLSPSTIAAYKRIRKNHFQELMQYKLMRITPERVQRAVNAMAKDSSPKTVRNAYGLLNAALREFRPNLNLRITLPQKQRYDAAVPSDDDVAKILKAVPGTEGELPITLALWLGMRMSEILGLKWKDYDGSYLHIRRALVDEGEKTTKTYSSQRDLRVPKHIAKLLKDRGDPEEHIVKMTRRRILTVFTRLCEQNGIQHYRFHDLRHINASVMLAQGVPDKYAMERMGHATNNMLKTVYQHTMSKQSDQYSKRIDQYFDNILKK